MMQIKKTAQQQGDESEATCQAYVLQHFAKGNPQLIQDTKYSSVHGIDFAFTTNDGNELFIIEVKSAKSKVDDDQMTPEGLLKRIKKLQQKNPHNSLLPALKKTLARNGAIKGMTYRVDEEHALPIRLVEPDVFFNPTELAQLATLLNQTPNNSLLLNTDSPGKNNMAENSIEHQIQLLQELENYLANFQEKLLGVSANYQRKVDALKSDGNLLSNIHRDYSVSQLEPTRASLAKVVEQISDNDIPAIKRYIAWLESLPR